MKISNIRYGFACNSSSTHSLLITYKKNKVKDKDVDEDFGWGYFTCASKEAKLLYLAGQLDANFPYDTPQALRVLTIRDWLGINITGDIPHVDHQSVWGLPYTYDGDFISKEFFQDLTKLLMNPSIVILGGNDNEGSYHPNRFEGSDLNLCLERESRRGSFRCRKDTDPVTKQEYWSLFSKEDGTKIRFSYEEYSERIERISNDN